MIQARQFEKVRKSENRAEALISAGRLEKVRKGENRRDRRDEPAVFYAVFSFIAPGVSFVITKGILRKRTEKKPKILESIKLLRNQLIRQQAKTAKFLGLANKLQGPSLSTAMLFQVRQFTRNGISA